MTTATVASEGVEIHFDYEDTAPLLLRVRNALDGEHSLRIAPRTTQAAIFDSDSFAEASGTVRVCASDKEHQYCCRMNGVRHDGTV